MAQTGKECVEFLENARNAVEALAVVEDREKQLIQDEGKKKKLLEMEQEANHIVVFDTFEEADRNAALSLALGMISILTGFMGYGLGIGIAGLIGGRLSRKVQPEKNGMALAGMILSGIGMAVSIMGMIVLCFVYSNLNGLSAVMMMNGVK